jgi:hypothetical protein
MKFAQFFQDGTGAYSATRLGFLLWVFGVLVVWIYDSIRCARLVPIDNSVVVIIGILMSGKVVQNFSENIGTQNGSQSDPTASGDIAPLPASKH